jgi:hypothetical protein
MNQAFFPGRDFFQTTGKQKSAGANHPKFPLCSNISYPPFRQTSASGVAVEPFFGMQ